MINAVFFKSSDLAMINKISKKELKATEKLMSLEFSPKNFIRKLWKNLKKS